MNPDLDRVNRELSQVQAALRSPTVRGVTTRRLYRRLESLYRELDRLENPDHEPILPTETPNPDRPAARETP